MSVTWLTVLVLAVGSPDARPRVDAVLHACGDAPAEGFVALPGAVAAASGEVTKVEQDVIEVLHCFLESFEERRVTAVFRGVQRVKVKVGQRVQRGEVLGTGKKVSVELGHGSVADFVKLRGRLVVPLREEHLVLVDVEGHLAVLFERGVEVKAWDVGRGQAEGAKEQRGDLRTPRGLYFVVDHTTGPFSGDFSEYFGGAWVKLNYPGADDAWRGLDAGLITAAQANDVAQRWSRREATPQGTKLGGGIGFHGWNAPWDGLDGGYGLSWGCVVMHPEEVRGFYELVPLGTPVVLL
ncbi:MAG: L,D-transpeptidase family protein [Myxococcaceae bacterium]